MMQRLRDQLDSPDATTARAAELLASMEPLDMKRARGWAHPWAAAELSRRRAPVGRLRVTVAGAVTFGSIVAAAATAQRAGWFGAVGASAMQPEVAVAAPAPLVPPAASEPVVPVESLPREPNPEVVAPAPRHAPSSSGESVLMVQAVRALRRDGDPARAQTLAEEALRRYPKGAQVEEAMALVMEAASARGDRSGARRAAARYLDRYPGGRFADRAQRVVSGSRDGD
jgi:hypothetical protein